MLALIGVIAYKMAHDLSSCNPPRARKRFVSLFCDFVLLNDGQHIRQSFSVACYSDSEIILESLQTVETVVRTQRHRLDDGDRLPMFWVGWTWQGFCPDYGSMLV